MHENGTLDGFGRPVLRVEQKGRADQNQRDREYGGEPLPRPPLMGSFCPARDHERTRDQEVLPVLRVSEDEDPLISREVQTVMRKQQEDEQENPREQQQHGPGQPDTSAVDVAGGFRERDQRYGRDDRAFSNVRSVGKRSHLFGRMPGRHAYLKHRISLRSMVIRGRVNL